MVGRNVSHFSCSVLNISKKHCPTILLYDSQGRFLVISFITLECKMTVNFHLLSIKQASECNELCTLNGNIHFFVYHFVFLAFQYLRISTVNRSLSYIMVSYMRCERLLEVDFLYQIFETFRQLILMLTKSYFAQIDNL